MYRNMYHLSENDMKWVEVYNVGDTITFLGSQDVDTLIEMKDKGQDPWFDAGHVGKEDVITKCGMNPIICEKGKKNHPLTDEQKNINREKSHTRCLVEHIFGFVEGAMNGSFVRSIGIIHAQASTALTCLVYNIFRYEQLCRCQPAIVKKALAAVQG